VAKFFRLQINIISHLTDGAPKVPSSARYKTLPITIKTFMKEPFTFKQFVRDFYSDFIVLTFSLLLFTILAMVISSSFTNSRIDGAYGGFSLGIFFSAVSFYFFRGHFNFLWTTVQLTIHLTLSVLLFLALEFILENVRAFNIPFQALIAGVILLTIICIIKQVMDNVGTSLGLKRRIKKPFDMTQ
jgi:hypothetical protein